MTYYLKLAFISFFIVTVCHGANGRNRVVAHGLGITAVLDATNSGPPTASSTGNVGHYDTNGHNGGSSAAYGAGDGQQHSSCTCESSAGSNNGSPTAGTSWGRWGGGGGGSESGSYDGGYGAWRGYGSFSGSNGGSGGSGSGSGGGYNP